MRLLNKLPELQSDQSLSTDAAVVAIATRGKIVTPRTRVALRSVAVM
jgi:hypothetical protein